MQHESNQLLPCPFCGEVPPADCYHADENQGTKWGSVICGCGIRGPEVRTGYDLGPDASWHETAAQEWNTRATAAPVVVGSDIGIPISGDTGFPVSETNQSLTAPVVVGEDASDELKALRVQEWMHREFNELASVQDIQQAMRTPCSCPFAESALRGTK